MLLDRFILEACKSKCYVKHETIHISKLEEKFYGEILKHNIGPDKQNFESKIVIILISISFNRSFGCSERTHEMVLFHTRPLDMKV